jgi:hypothetical protein
MSDGHNVTRRSEKPMTVMGEKRMENLLPLIAPRHYACPAAASCKSG